MVSKVLRFEKNYKIAGFFAALVIFDLIFYTILINNLPVFLWDDYYLFGKIKENIANQKFIDYQSLYSIFMRPLSYLTHFIDFLIWKYNSSAMKYESLVLLLITISLFWITLSKIQVFFCKEKNNLIIFLLSAVFSTHIIAVTPVLWISGRNELLMVLFYIICVYLLFRYLEDSNRTILYFIPLFFILGILSKQQMLHLPLLMLTFILFFKNKIEKEKFRSVIQIISLTIIISLIFVLLNIFYILDTSDNVSFLWENILRKPFSIIGSLVITAIPYGGSNIYDYFLDNPNIALVLMVLLMLAVILFIITFQKYRKTIFFTSLLFFISFIPQAYLKTEPRLCSIQAFLIYLLIGVLLTKLNLKHLKYTYILLLILLFSNFIEAKKYISDSLVSNNSCIEVLQRLDNFLKVNSQQVLVLCGPLGLNLPYEYYYVKYNEFGSDSIKNLPIWEISGYEDYYSISLRPTVSATMKKDTLNLEVLTDRGFLTYSNAFNIFQKIKILSKEKDKSNKIRKLSILMDNELFLNNHMIYFNGSDWESVFNN
jgi:hypothetical protein